MESHYIKIYTGSFIIVQIMTTKLEEIGISPIIKDEMESNRLSGFPRGEAGLQEVYVHETELDQAVPIIEGALAEMQV